MNKKPRGAEAGPDIRLFKEKTSKAKGADSAPKTRKKGHKKQNSHPENYYFLNIYKTNSSEKNSGGHMVKNLSIPDKMCANYEQSYPADYSPMNGHSACEKLNYIRRAIYDGSSAKLKIKDQRIVEHHHRSLSYGEKYNFGRRPASKSKNKSFYGGISDERKKSRKVSGINSGSRHSFLKKLRKIWKNSGKSLSNSKYKTYGYIMQSQYGGYIQD